MDEITTAAAYIRVSTEDQEDLSPDVQLQLIRDYARENKLLLLAEHVYQDDGISGRKAEHRPAFNRMIADAQRSPAPFSKILVWKFSRFARNTDEATLYKAKLHRSGVDVVSISEPIPEGPVGNLVEFIFDWEAEFYSLRLAEEVKRDMKENHLRGNLQSTPAFGYYAKDRVLVPHEEEAPIVREIFKRFIDGEGYFPIARDLNTRGIKTHRGNRMEHRTIEYIIRNPVYIGKLRWNPTGRTRRNFDDPNIILVDGKHEPLIDVKTWEAAQKRVREIKEIYPRYRKPSLRQKSWISGLMRCSKCGKTLCSNGSGRGYVCGYFSKGVCMEKYSIKQDIAEKLVIDRMRYDAERNSDLAFSAVSSSDKPSERSQLEKTRSSLKRKIEKLREAYFAGVEDLETYAALKKATEQEIEKIDRKIVELTQTVDPTECRDRLRNAILETLKTLTDPNADQEQKHTAAEQIIEKIVFYGSENRIELYYRIFLE